jgi:copper(I)-binding protein
MRPVLLLCCLALATSPALAEDFQVDKLTISDGWAKATTQERVNTEGYVTIQNDGPEDKLVGASCDGTNGTTLVANNMHFGHLHGLEPMGTDMEPILIEIDVPEHSRVVMKPGGLHIMLEDELEPLKVGSEVGCRLEFRDSGPIDVVLKVAPADATVPPAS